MGEGMSMRRAAFATVLVLLGLTACASGGGGSADGGSSGGNRNLIVAEELTDISGTTYDAVLQLRPRWLQARGGQDSDLPATFVDGSFRGDYRALQSVPLANVNSIRYLSPADATTLFGTGYQGGVIEVRTR
jgi:hypothetical protein